MTWAGLTAKRSDPAFSTCPDTHFCPLHEAGTRMCVSIKLTGLGHDLGED